MAWSLRVPLSLVATLVLSLAMMPTALKFVPERDYPILGGLQDVDADDDGVQQAVEFAVREYNSENNDPNLSRLVRVVRARQQVVAGVNYYLDLEIGRTTCAKSQPEQDDCPFSEEPTQLCSFVVYSRPWEDYTSLTGYSCHHA